jgi:hypothetical protein
VHHLVEAQRGVGLPIRDCRRWGSPVPPAQDEPRGHHERGQDHTHRRVDLSGWAGW